MAKRRTSSGSPPLNDVNRYYDEENRREEARERNRFQRYDDAANLFNEDAPRQRAAARSQKAQRPRYAKSRAAGSRGRRSKYRQPRYRQPRYRQPRYRLEHPEKLLFGLGLLIALVVVIVLISRSLGSSGSAEGGADSQQPVQTVQSAQSSAQTGTVRSVSNTELSQIPNQLAAYMVSMLGTNGDNQALSQGGSSQTTVQPQFDASQYAMVVAIDPGHGGSDAGWESGEAVEKDIALKVAEMVQSYINQNAPAYFAVLTRNSDVAMGDQARLDVATTYSAGLLVSIHCNGSELELGGTSAAYWTGDGDDATRAAQSEQLAQTLMGAAAEGFGMWEREVRVEDTPLLHTTIPSVMVEMGYVTYSLDNELMQQESLQEEAAQAIAQALIDYMQQVAPADMLNNDAGADASESSVVTEN